jgi:hypothetical protein
METPRESETASKVSQSPFWTPIRSRSNAD